jgi:hypothetical protein
MARMHKTTIYLDEVVYGHIRRLAKASGRTQAEIIREAIASYTASVAPLGARSVGLGASGTHDLSERTEDLLDGLGRDQ